MQINSSEKNSGPFWVILVPHGKTFRRVKVELRHLLTVAGLFVVCLYLSVAFVRDYGAPQQWESSDAALLRTVSLQKNRMKRQNDTLRLEIAEKKGQETRAGVYQRELRGQVDQLAQFVRSASALGLVEGNRLSAVASKLGPSVGGAEVEVKLLDAMREYVSVLRTIPFGAPGQGDLTSNFGYRESPFGAGIRAHEGIDVSMPTGSIVYSTAEGVIEDVAYDGTYGLRIDVRHGSKLVSRYAHLSKSLLEKGDRVSTGEVIALSGSSGSSTGPHLHYEIRIDGEAKDPVKVLGLARQLDKFRQPGGPL